LLQPLIERVDKLETLLRAQAEQMAELQRQLGERQAEAAKAVAPTAEPQSAADVQQDYQLGDTIALDVEPAPVAETYYLPAPTPDGLFTEESRIAAGGQEHLPAAQHRWHERLFRDAVVARCHCHGHHQRKPVCEACLPLSKATPTVCPSASRR
jgi:hypothetical protein